VRRSYAFVTNFARSVFDVPANEIVSFVSSPDPETVAELPVFHRGAGSVWSPEPSAA